MKPLDNTKLQNKNEPSCSLDAERGSREVRAAGVYKYTSRSGQTADKVLCQNATRHNDLIDRIFSLSKHGIKMGLGNMVSALKILNLDLSRIRFIHIAGTNGKGSTASTLDSLIRRHSNGLNTGLYTSPHLIKFNERITVNGKEITDDEMIVIAEMLFNNCSNIELTFFEFTTLMALCHFVNKKIDFAIMETGLGGRLDATNVISPEVAIITSIAHDHMEYLGESLPEIAMEKAGIFKKGSSIILSKTCCNDLLKQKAQEVGVKSVYELGHDFGYHVNNDESFNFLINNKPIYGKITKKLLGEHQYSNTCVALMALTLMGLKGSNESVNKALSSVNWLGRLEPLTIKGKMAYIDVSHNVEGIEKTIEFLKTTHKNEPIYTACGFVKDKEYKKMITMLNKMSKKVFLIPTTVPGRELGKVEYNNMAIENPNQIICDDFADAVDRITKEDGILLFTGSIYNYEHLRRTLQEVTKCS